MLELVVKQTALRAKKSNFGKDDLDLIRTLYLRLECLVESELPDSIQEMALFMNQHITLSVIPFGSGAIFNMQGFLENKNVPAEIKDLITRIFIRLDSRDLNYRFGPCSCLSCAKPVSALLAHLEFLEDQKINNTYH